MKRKSLGFIENKENDDHPVFKMFCDAMKDPQKKDLILNVLAKEKGLSDFKMKLLQNPCTPPKKIEKKTFESPSALMRRRQLLELRGLAVTKQSEKEINSPGESTPLGEILSNVVAYVDVNSQGVDRSSGVKALLMSMGANVSEKLGRGVTHVIFKDGSYETYRKAKMLRAYFLSVLWVDACRRKHRFVPEAEYPALSGKNYDQNISLLCSQMQKNYVDVVREEIRTNIEQGIPLPSTKKIIKSKKRMTVSTIHDIFDSSRSSFSLSQSEGTSHKPKENLQIESELTGSDLISEDDSTCGVVDGELNGSGFLSKSKTGKEFDVDKLKENLNKSCMDLTCVNISDDLSPDNSPSKEQRDFSDSASENPSENLLNDAENFLSTPKVNNRYSFSVKDVLHEILSKTNVSKFTNDSDVSKKSDDLILNLEDRSHSKKNLSDKSSDLLMLGEENNEEIAIDSFEKMSYHDQSKTKETNLDEIDKEQNISDKNDVSDGTTMSSLRISYSENKTNSSDATRSEFDKTHSESNRNEPRSSTDSFASEVNKLPTEDDSCISLTPFVTDRKKRINHRVTSETTNETPSRRKSMRIQQKVNLEATKLTETPNKNKKGAVPSTATKISCLEVVEDESLGENCNKESIIKSIVSNKKKELIFHNDSDNPSRKSVKNTEVYEEPYSQDWNDINKRSRSAEKGSKKLRKLYNPETIALDLEHVKKINDDLEREKRRKEIALTLNKIDNANVMLSSKAKERLFNEPDTIDKIAPLLDGFKIKEEEKRTEQNVFKAPICRAARLLTQVPPHHRSSRRSTLEFETGEALLPRAKQKPEFVPTIVFTRTSRSDLRKFDAIVKRLGGFVAEEDVTLRTTHLVVSEAKRTINLIRAIARGCWIVKSEWILDSMKHHRWMNEEDYELTEFSPAVQKCRLERKAFGSTYTLNIFQNFGSIFISKSTKPPYRILRELIILCKGKVTKVPEIGVVCIGGSYDNCKCVGEAWVLDSISAGKLKPLHRYLLPSGHKNL